MAASQPEPLQTLGPDLAQALPAAQKRASGHVLAALDAEQRRGLAIIRQFLRNTTNYDVLPLSFRLIVFDTGLLVRKSLNILIQNGIVSAPLWDSKRSTFAGMLTAADYINVIQYYWQNPDALKEIDQFQLTHLPEVEKSLGVKAIDRVSIHPEQSLYESCQLILQARAHRIPLIDVDDETQRPMIVSVLTQYRLLKFIAMNAKETQMLRRPIMELGIGTYRDIVTARMDTMVIDIIHALVKHNVSSIPILDSNGRLMNIIDSVDVVMLIQGGSYEELDVTVAAALLKRPTDFPGIYTCSPLDRLDTIFDTIRKARVHRFVVVDDESGEVCGVLTLSDILKHILEYGEDSIREEDETALEETKELVSSPVDEGEAGAKDAATGGGDREAEKGEPGTESAPKEEAGLKEEEMPSN